MSYTLEVCDSHSPQASFHDGVIRILAPRQQVCEWANGESIGLYFDLPANGTYLKVSIEKDLECVEAPPEERDGDAFPRVSGKHC